MDRPHAEYMYRLSRIPYRGTCVCGLRISPYMFTVQGGQWVYWEVVHAIHP